MEQLGKYCTVRIGDDVINLDGLVQFDFNELLPNIPSLELIEVMLDHNQRQNRALTQLLEAIKRLDSK